MKLKNTLLSFFLLLGVLNLNAQDRHFTQYNLSPLTLNPALTGAYSGTIRIGGIYRSQDAVGGGFPAVFSTPSFYVDAPLLVVRKNDWLSAGLLMYSDKAGSLELSNNFYALSVAYHLALDKNANSVLTLGIQAGQASRKLGLGVVPILDDPNEILVNTTTGESENASYIDVNSGLMFRSKLNKTMSFEIGVAANHIPAPEYGLLNNEPDTTVMPPIPAKPAAKQSLLFAAHGKFDVALTETVSFAPSFFLQTVKGAGPEMVLQVPFGLQLDKEENKKISFGLGYRIGDALQVLLGYDHKDLRVGVAYDVPVSSKLSSIQTTGGLEIAASYIIKVYKKPQIPPAIICPRF